MKKAPSSDGTLPPDHWLLRAVYRGHRDAMDGDPDGRDEKFTRRMDAAVREMRRRPYEQLVFYWMEAA